MLRQIQIYQGSRCLYGAQYGKSLDDESLANVLLKIQHDLQDTLQQPTYAPILFDYFKFRILAIYLPDNGILILLITDVTDAENRIKSQLLLFKGEFVKVFGTQPNLQLNNRDIENLNTLIEKLQKGLFPKISFVGYSGVGKTTLTRLMLGAEIPQEHVPTITGTINMVQIGSICLNIWDEAGQEQFQFVWSKLLQGSDVIFIVTDSTKENVEKSIYFVDLAKKEAPHARIAIIANKQDLPGAIPALEIKQKLGGIRTFSMVASDPASRQKIFNITSDILEILPQDEPNSQLLLGRDRLQEELKIAIKNNDASNALRLCAALETTYEALGDEGTSAEYHSKAEGFRATLGNSKQFPNPNVSAPNLRLPELGDVHQQPTIEPENNNPILPPISDTSGTFSLMQTPKLVPNTGQKLKVYETIWNLSLKKLNLDKHIRTLEKQVALGSLPLETFTAMKEKAVKMTEEIDREIAQNRELIQQIVS